MDYTYLIQLVVTLIGISASIAVPIAVSVEFRKRLKSKLSFQLLGHDQPEEITGTGFERVVLADQEFHKKWTIQFKSGRFALGNSKFRICPQLKDNSISGFGKFTQNGPHIDYKVFRNRGLVEIELKFMAEATTSEFEITFIKPDFPRIYCENLIHQARIVPYYIWQKSEKYREAIRSMHFRLMILLLVFLAYSIIIIGRLLSLLVF